MLLLSLLISHVLSSSLALSDDGNTCNTAEGWVLEDVSKSCVKWVTTPVKAKEAAAACAAMDSRAGLVVIQTKQKQTKLDQLISDAGIGSTQFMTAGVASDPFVKTDYGAASWAMVDKTLDPFGVHEFAYDETETQDFLGVTATDWLSDPKEFGKDGVVTWTSATTTMAQLTMVFGPSENTYGYICEVCKTTDIKTCGSIAQIIEKEGETLPIVGTGDFPASCPDGQTLKGIDTEICKNCKCWKAGQATKKLKLDDKGNVLAHEPYSRKECKKAAIAEGYPVFSYLALGFKSACVYGKEFSSGMACNNLRRENLDPSRPWVMMSVKKECIQSCTAEPRDIKVGYKCNTLGEVRYHKQKTRLLNIMDCAQAAYNHGRLYFSWHKTKRWCYFGRDKSGEDECGPSNMYETSREQIKVGTNPDTGADIMGTNQHAMDWIVAKAQCETPTAKWVIADAGLNCDVTCANQNLECDDTAFKAQLGDVNTAAKFRQVIDDNASPTLQQQLLDNPPEECDEGDAAPVPNFVVAQNVCFYSKQGRTVDPKCDANPVGDGKQRVCWCSVKSS